MEACAMAVVNGGDDSSWSGAQSPRLCIVSAGAMAVAARQQPIQVDTRIDIGG